MHARMASGVLLALGFADLATLNLVLAPRLAGRAGPVALAPAATPPCAPEASQPPAAPEDTGATPAAPAPTAPPEFRAVDEPAGADIVFPPGELGITSPDVSAEVRRLAAELSASGDRKLVVRGHSDRLGTSEGNLSLSWRRAKSVARLLASFGAPADRILVEAAGSAEPADTTDTPTGWARNRRVQLLWR
jgi:peptidoglycan-associated lipoprotein